MIGWMLVCGWAVAAPWTYTASWTDADRLRHSVEATLPDRAEPVRVNPQARAEYAVAAVKAWAKTQPGVGVQAGAKRGVVTLRMMGEQASRKSAKEAMKVVDEATDAWMRQAGFVELKVGWSVDHAARVGPAAEAVAPLAVALRKGNQHERAFVWKALGFVQAIPYEPIATGGRSVGFRPAVGVLAQQAGDCDSKAVLYLALIRAVYPDLPVAIVVVKGHALVGVGIEPEKGEKTFKHDGVEYVYAEPVGPARTRLGEIGKQTKLGGKQVLVVP